MANTKAKGANNNGAQYSDEYYTPKQFYEPLGSFDFDPCAGPVVSIAMVNNRDQDGLSIAWFGRVWLNPPYSRNAKALFLAKLALHGSGTALVPASTDTAWFATAFEKAAAVVLVTGRIQFVRGDGKASANASGSAYFAYGTQDAQQLVQAVESGQIKGMIIKRP